MSSEKSKILESAQQFTIRGQINKAIEEWKKLLTDTPNDANILNTIGDLSLKSQSPGNGSRDAISYYIKAADIFVSSGFALKAIAVYKKILKVEPSRKDIYVRLGDLNCDRGLIGNAREDYLTAAKLYSQDGRIKEALEVYRKIADLDPSNLNVRIKIAEIFFKEGLKEDAIEEYNKVALAYLKEAKRDEAENLYRLILKFEPNNLNAIVKIGRLRLDDGYVDEAIGYGKMAFDLSKESPDALSLLVDSYIKSKMYDDAETLLTKLIELHPDQLSHRDTLATILVAKGNNEGAANVYLVIGTEYFNHNDLDKSLIYAEKAKEISPDLLPAHELLFEVYSNRGNKDNILGKGLYLAKYFYDTGEKEKAKRYYLRILEEDPFNVEAKEGLEKVSGEETKYKEEIVKEEGVIDVSGQIASAEVYIKYGLLEKAILELQDIVKRSEPDNIEAHVKLKNLYKNTGEQDKAFEECLKLIRIYEPLDEPDKIELLIREAIEVSPYDSRIKEYKERLIKRSQVDFNELLEEARFYEQQGMIEEAISVYNRILSIDSVNEEAIREIAKLKRLKSVDTIPEVELVKPEESPVSFFDLGEALKEEVKEKPIYAPAPMEISAVKSFEEIFQEFNKGIQAQLSPEDYETHYDLGIAYKEMGLFQEAVEEFKISIQGTPRYMDASYMIALCYKELGEYHEAVKALEGAISSQQYSDQRHLVVKYELGSLFELAGKKEDALHVFTEVHDTDETYRDVSERVLNLQKGI